MFNSSQLFGGRFYDVVLSASKDEEARCGFRSVRVESVIEVDHARNLVSLLLVPRVVIFSFTFHFCLEGPHTLFIYHMTKVTYLVCPKSCFCPTSPPVHNREEAGKYPFQVLQVLLFLLVGDKDAVNERKTVQDTHT